MRFHELPKLALAVCVGVSIGTMQNSEKKILPIAAEVAAASKPKNIGARQSLTLRLTDNSTSSHGDDMEISWKKKMEHKNPAFIVAEDDLLFGKSCLMASEGWDCRDCGLQSNNYFAREDCPVLPRNGICNRRFKPPSRWDTRARQSSEHDSVVSASASYRRVFTSIQRRSPKFEQVPCQSVEDCFDMTKCPADRPIKLFAHSDDVNNAGLVANRLVIHAVQHYPHMLQRTYHPSDACLLIIAPDSYSNTSASELLQRLYDYGRNHFIWDNGNCAGGYPDDPFDVTMNYQYAALANGAMTDDIVRRGYDVPLPRVAHSSMLLRTTRLPVDDAPRHYLLSFKGTINDWPQFWYYHRWMAVEYWNHTTSTTTKAKESDIVVDVQCDDGGRNYTSSDYVTLLLNSTFGFAPGGASVGSYRFGEVLGLGGIPVVLQDFVPPMWPELDWSGCILKVSEARLVDLPRILRAISKEEIRSRQQRCKVLFQQTIGWKKVGIEMWEIDNGVRSFLTAMKVWNWRIQDYHAKQMRQTAFD